MSGFPGKQKSGLVLDVNLRISTDQEKSKRCTRCKKTKPLNEFYISARAKDGYTFWCRLCYREYRIIKYESIDKEARNEKIKTIRKNSEYVRTVESLRTKRYRENNPEKAKANNKRSKDKNREAINAKARKHNQLEPTKKKNAERVKRKRERDSSVRLNHAMTASVNHSLKVGGDTKRRRQWSDIVGYTTKELIVHLEKQFTEGMTWENYGKGGWNIDHKIPVTYFKFSSIDDLGFIMLWSLENLQPLWETDNIRKGNKVDLSLLEEMQDNTIDYISKN